MKRHYWTPQETSLLKEMYPDHKTQDIADILNKCIDQVYKKAAELGVKKSDEFLRSEMSGRRKPGDGVIGGTFQKGHTPWNKGKKGLFHGSVKTQFRINHTPHNTKYDGCISIRQDRTGRQYKYMRVSMAHWEPLHRRVWIENFGSIPEGYLVAFRDGNTLNCDPENLELITREDNMKRNSIMRYPDELRSTIKLLRKAQKQINKLSKEGVK